MAQVAKRAGRATTEGLVGYRIDGGVGTMVAVGCETEPVSKNEEFQAFAKQRARGRVDADGPEAVESLEEERVEVVAKLGENIVVVGAERLRGGRRARSSTPTSTRRRTRSACSSSSRAAARSSRASWRCTSRSPRREWLTREEVPAETSRPSARSISTRTSSRASRSRRRRRSSRACSRSGSTRCSPAARSTEQPWIHDSAKTVGQALDEAGRGSSRSGASLCRRIGP